MNRRRQVSYLLVLVLLGGAVILTYAGVRAFDQTKAPRVHLLIQQILSADMQSEQDMMQIYNHTLFNYDDLAERADLQWTLFDQLSAELTTADESKELEALKQSLGVQHAAIDRFKSGIGILNNSERYLPVLAEQLSGEHPDKADQLMDMSLNIMRWIAVPGSVGEDQLGRQIEAIVAAGFPVLARHARVVLEQLERSKDAIDVAVNCGTPENATALSQAFDKRAGKQIAQYYRQTRWLTVLIMLLIAGFAWLAWAHYRDARRLLRSSRRQKSLNALLGIAIEDRPLTDRLQDGLECILAQPWLGMAARGSVYQVEDGQLVMVASSNMREAADMCATVPFGECLCGVAALSGNAVFKQHIDCMHSRRLPGTKDHGHCIMPLSADKAVLGILNLYVPAGYTLSASEQAFLDASVHILAQMIATEAAHETMRRLEMAIEQIPDTVFITDREGTVVYANPQCVHAYGMGLDTIVGSPVYRLRGGEKGDALNLEIDTALHAGQSWQGEITLADHANGTQAFRRIVAPMIEGDTVRYHVCIDHDITVERAMQTQVEHMQRLESLGVLAGGIAHDFNNILTAILGNAAMAERKAMSNPMDAQRYLSNIVGSSEKAAELCKQMLAYSGKGKFVVRPIDLSAMVEEITKLLEISIAKGVVLNYQLADQLPAVEADAAQLQQVIMNLVINASDAINDNSGVISIATGVMQADCDYLAATSLDDALPAGRYIYLEVSDTGCGMDDQTQARLFEPFFTTKFTGHGLGMSAVLGIVRGHQGAIKVYSEPGQGTIFKVLLPASDSVVDVVVDQSPGEQRWCGDGVVLIIDDEESIRETAAMMLEEMGFATLSAVDGEDGVRVYCTHQQQITAVLMDMTMPKMDGMACFSELRRINPYVKVILSSGYNEQEATSRFTGKGLAGFIQKPYHPDALATTMRQAIVGRE